MLALPHYIVTQSQADLAILGNQIAKRLQIGDVLGLDGKLGVGKTTLTRAIVSGLGITDSVTSQTFTLIQKYGGGSASVPVYHADLYRIESAEALSEIGLYDVMAGKEIVIIEWAGRYMKYLPTDIIKIGIEFLDENKRGITIEY